MTPVYIDAGDEKNYTIKIRPPYEGGYIMTVRTESIQLVRVEKNVTVNVAIDDKPLEELPLMDETVEPENVTEEPDEPVVELPETNETVTLTSEIEEIRLQADALRKHASPTSKALLERVYASLEMAGIADENGDIASAQAAVLRADTLLSEALEFEETGGVNTTIFYGVILLFVLSVIYVFKMEITGQEAFYHWRIVFRELEHKFNR